MKTTEEQRYRLPHPQQIKTIADEAFRWKQRNRWSIYDNEDLEYFACKVVHFYLPIYRRFTTHGIKVLQRIKNKETVNVKDHDYVENKLSAFTYGVDGEYALRDSGKIILEIHENCLDKLIYP